MAVSEINSVCVKSMKQKPYSEGEGEKRRKKICKIYKNI